MAKRIRGRITSWNGRQKKELKGLAYASAQFRKEALVIKKVSAQYPQDAEDDKPAGNLPEDSVPDPFVEFPHPLS